MFLPSCSGKRLLSSPSGKRPKDERRVEGREKYDNKTAQQKK